MPAANPPYRGRLAPTPTGRLHLGHAATFLTAAERAAQGTLVLRMEDLDLPRCLPEYADGILEDLAWVGLSWDEGPDFGGPFGPYRQSERRENYLAAWKKLRDGGFIYPCRRSRKDVATAAAAPHEEEPIFPLPWRANPAIAQTHSTPEGWNWRFRVPDHEDIAFQDGLQGEIHRLSLRDFGDFLVWNRENIPAYELAVVTDDIAMAVTEVVRGEDLLTATARQILLYRALQASPPKFYHVPLIMDVHGRRLAKREKSLGLHTLREQGWSPEQVRDEVYRLRTQNPPTRILSNPSHDCHKISLNREPRLRAFSSVELLLVIAVLALMAWWLIPQFSGIVKSEDGEKPVEEIANSAKDQSNARNIVSMWTAVTALGSNLPETKDDCIQILLVGTNVVFAGKSSHYQISGLSDEDLASAKTFIGFEAGSPPRLVFHPEGNQ